MKLAVILSLALSTLSALGGPAPRSAVGQRSSTTSFDGVVYDPGFRNAAANLEAHIFNHPTTKPSLYALRLGLRLDEFVIQARRYRVIVPSWSPKLLALVSQLLSDTQNAADNLRTTITASEFNELAARLKEANLSLLGH